jgi:hypothetical protein
MVGMARATACLVMLAGCGRFGFAPESSSTLDGGVNSDEQSPPIDDAWTGDGSGDSSMMPMAWAPTSPTFPAGSNLYAVWAFAPDNIWVGGDNGELDQFDGTTWVSYPDPLQDIYGMWAASTTDIWEVGALCEVRRWNGSTWGVVTVPNCGMSSMLTISGAAANDVWFGGVSGALFHYTGGTPTLVSQANNVDLWGIHAFATNNVYVVGTRGTILRWNGSSFGSESLAITIQLASVWGSSPNDVWAVGGGGVIYRKLNNGPWTAVTSPTTQFLYSVWGTSATDVWAIGDVGTAIHFDGTSWKTVAMPTSLPLRAMTGVPGDGIRAVGHIGTVLTYN